MSPKFENLYVALKRNIQYNDFNKDNTYNIELIAKTFGLSQRESFLVVWSESEIDEINAESLLSVWEYLGYSDSDEAIILYQ